MGIGAYCVHGVARNVQTDRIRNQIRPHFHAFFNVADAPTAFRWQVCAPPVCFLPYSRWRGNATVGGLHKTKNEYFSTQLNQVFFRSLRAPSSRQKLQKRSKIQSSIVRKRDTSVLSIAKRDANPRLLAPKSSSQQPPSNRHSSQEAPIEKNSQQIR